MKNFIFALGCTIAIAIPAHAGSLSETMVEPAPELMTLTEPGPSVSNWLVPVLVVTLLVGVAAITNQDD